MARLKAYFHALSTMIPSQIVVKIVPSNMFGFKVTFNYIFIYPLFYRIRYERKYPKVHIKATILLLTET